MNNIEDNRINKWLEKIVVFFIATSVAATAAFQWQLYKSNQDIHSLLKMHDMKIAYLESQIVDLKNEVSFTKSQMVGWDTLKRIELFLTAQSQKSIDTNMSAALKMELESRQRK